jgi:hypothetical protein
MSDNIRKLSSIELLGRLKYGESTLPSYHKVKDDSSKLHLKDSNIIKRHRSMAVYLMDSDHISLLPLTTLSDIIN